MNTAMKTATNQPSLVLKRRLATRGFALLALLAGVVATGPNAHAADLAPAELSAHDPLSGSSTAAVVANNNANPKAGNPAPGNRANLTQNGVRQQLLLTQAGNGNDASAVQNGSANLIDITQSGQGNQATLQQGGFGNQAKIVQHGNQNTARIEQLGHNGKASITQNGSGYKATVIQN
jgi:minor curlin subunit